MEKVVSFGSQLWLAKWPKTHGTHSTDVHGGIPSAEKCGLLTFVVKVMVDVGVLSQTGRNLCCDVAGVLHVSPVLWKVCAKINLPLPRDCTLTSRTLMDQAVSLHPQQSIDGSFATVRSPSLWFPRTSLYLHQNFLSFAVKTQFLILSSFC